MSQNNGWIGVDLDGTLAKYDGWKGIDHIGAPIPKMVERIKKWRQDGKEVRVFTARIAAPQPLVVRYIEDWCIEHIGEALPITNQKDFSMIELWDDRAIQVTINTGERVDGIAD